MKTKSMYLAALFVMGVAATALGHDEPRKAGLAVVSAKGSEVFKVIYKAESAGKVKLNLYNANSEMMFSETISDTEGFILPLNFKALSYGEYTLEIIDAAGKRVEHISYQPVQSLENIRVVKISGVGDKFLVTVVNAVNEKITVKIFDAYNNLVHNQSMDVSGDFAQVYSFKNISGNCTFEISDSAGNVKTAQF